MLETSEKEVISLLKYKLPFFFGIFKINDRGLFYGQYDWTRPPPDPPPVGYEKELCGLTGDALWGEL